MVCSVFNKIPWNTKSKFHSYVVTSKIKYRLRVNNSYECVFAEVLKKAHRVIQHTVVNHVTFFPNIFSKKMNWAWRTSRFVNKNIVTTQWHVCRRFDNPRSFFQSFVLVFFVNSLYFCFKSTIQRKRGWESLSKRRHTFRFCLFRYAFFI